MQKTFSVFDDFESFQAIACSLPPLPITQTFIGKFCMNTRFESNERKV